MALRLSQQKAASSAPAAPRVWPVIDLLDEQGKTIIAIGHDLNLAHHASTHALLLMGDGEWTAGPAADVMSAPLLSRYLDHPIEVLVHGARRIFISSEG